MVKQYNWIRLVCQNHSVNTLLTTQQLSGTQRVKNDLKKGHILVDDDIIALRPISVGGFEPFDKHILIGKQMVKDIKAGEHLTKQNFKL